VFQKVRSLFFNLVVYGLGDVATSIVGFLLLYVFTRILSTVDYGVLYLLLTVELVAKLVFRWGVDASFMRLYHDCHDDTSRRELASTLFFFLLAVNGIILAVVLILSPHLASLLFGANRHTLALQFVLVNTFIGSFNFIPFNVLRIQRKALVFSSLTFSRSVATILFRVLLVAVFRLGVLGMVLADVCVTVLFAPVLLRWFVPLIRLTFSREVLREALRFGLPRMPHGVAQQVVGPTTDAMLLRLLLREPTAVAESHIGLYGTGASFGLIIKLFLSAFETAWAPFYFGSMKEPDAKRTFAVVTTYGMAILALLVAGLSAVATDLIRLMTPAGFHPSARIVPWVALGVFLQGVYLLTSIGLNITKHTEYYPISTGLAAAANIGSNLVLIPRFGYIGAAWSNVVSYAVLAATAWWFSHRLYHITYEWRRLSRVVFAGIVAYLVPSLLVPRLQPLHPLAGVLLRGTLVVAVFPVCLSITGFFRAGELTRLGQLAAHLRLRPAPLPVSVLGLSSGPIAVPVQEVAAGQSEADQE
jgi:O-antigen/teichoic acid export membrane protein